MAYPTYDNEIKLTDCHFFVAHSISAIECDVTLPPPLSLLFQYILSHFIFLYETMFKV